MTMGTKAFLMYQKSKGSQRNKIASIKKKLLESPAKLTNTNLAETRKDISKLKG